MKVAEINTIQNSQPKKQQYRQNPNAAPLNFRGAGSAVLSLADGLMGYIDSQGYIISFLLQDGLGMGVPRIGTGLLRDREETGELNFKEAIEVFLREALSGPYMMFVAPIMIAITGKFCKSMNTNTRLIKSVGNNLKSMIKDPAFDKSIQKDSNKFHEKFVRYNIEKMYKNTIPTDNDADTAINYILDEFKNLYNKDSKVRGQSIENITNKINDRMLRNTHKLDSLNRVKMTVDNKEQTFKTKDVINAIKSYSDDAIMNNRNAAAIDEFAAENIKNNFAGKRLFFNIANIVATLGGLAVIPKIYARGKVAPGAQQMLKLQEETKKQKELQKQNVNNNKENEVSFKGKGINTKGFFEKLGQFLTKKIPNWVQEEFEYDGRNFTKSLMACLALFGLLFPRGMTAYKRAMTDENGNKDLTELNEILLRDTTSSLGVVYTVPILTKCFVKGCENKTGYVLTNRASNGKSEFKKFLDVINPYSSLRVLDSADLQSLYNNIDTKQKMLNLCTYITEKGGDLEKILSKSSNANMLFNNKTTTLESLRKLSKSEKNKKITNIIKNLDNKKADELISKVMQDRGKIAKSTITRMARGLYSVPGAITTLIISPVILGCLIPMLTYSNTRKAHAKMAEQMQQQNKLK